MILVLPVLLLLIPLVLQSYFGSDLLKKRKLHFYLLAAGNVVLMLLMIVAGLLISLKGQQIKGINGLSPGFLAFGLIALFFLLVYITVQVFRNRC